jgi:uncharacterized damage-inducible protein DinB
MQNLLAALLDSWDRNNTILVNLLRAIPKRGLEIGGMEGSPSVAQMFAHIHYVRLVFVAEDMPELASRVPAEEWAAEPDPERMAQNLNESAAVVRQAVSRAVTAGTEMQVHYDHPILLLQHMLWHEGYHHGQIKLALKLAGAPLTNDAVGPATWGVWMRKTPGIKTSPGTPADSPRTPPETPD